MGYFNLTSIRKLQAISYVFIVPKMRLLHTRLHYFEEYFDADIPEYAILSHRWGQNEVSYKVFRKNTADPEWDGLWKIRKCCEVAAAKDIEWVWIDTCCIDKRSSAELTEAINSMYKWYERAAMCFIHLYDVQISHEALERKPVTGTDDKTGSGHEESRNSRDETLWNTWLRSQPELLEQLRKSDWFTRSWTLQELLASKNRLFLDARWNEIGAMSPYGALTTEISRITRILATYLVDWERDFDVASIAERMSWASDRICSREEDTAYSLLGLFDVNMPLLYGEGAKKAFRRLQVQIMKESADESHFAWTSDDCASGLLADSPSCFKRSGNVRPIVSTSKAAVRPPYSISNKGLALAVPDSIRSFGLVPIYLNCAEISPYGDFDTSRNAMCIQVVLQGSMAVRIGCQFVRAPDYPTPYKNCSLHALKSDLQTTRTVHIQDYKSSWEDSSFYPLLALILRGQARLVDFLPKKPHGNPKYQPLGILTEADLQDTRLLPRRTTRARDVEDATHNSFSVLRDVSRCPPWYVNFKLANSEKFSTWEELEKTRRPKPKLFSTEQARSTDEYDQPMLSIEEP